PRGVRRREAPAAPLPADPLRAGEAAAAAFDYERARQSFRRALEQATPERRVPAARALLTLLVDALGDDDAALALDGRLPAEAEAAARALLLRWPDCAVARGALGSVAAERRRAEAEALLRAGEEALREGRPAAAIGPLSEALRRATAAPLRERLRQLLTEADH